MRLRTAYESPTPIQTAPLDHPVPYTHCLTTRRHYRLCPKPLVHHCGPSAGAWEAPICTRRGARVLRCHPRLVARQPSGHRGQRMANHGVGQREDGHVIRLPCPCLCPRLRPAPPTCSPRVCSRPRKLLQICPIEILKSPGFWCNLCKVVGRLESPSLALFPRVFNGVWQHAYLCACRPWRKSPSQPLN